MKPTKAQKRSQRIDAYLKRIGKRRSDWHRSYWMTAQDMIAADAIEANFRPFIEMQEKIGAKIDKIRGIVERMVEAADAGDDAEVTRLMQDLDAVEVSDGRR